MARRRRRPDHGRDPDESLATEADHTADTGSSASRNHPHRIHPEQPLSRVLVAASIGLAVFSLAVPNMWPIPQLHDPSSGIRQFVAVSDEQNLPTWFNVVLLAHAASASLLVAILLRQAGRPGLARAWRGLAAVVALLSLDDLASLHEKLEPLGRDIGGGSGALHFAWVLPGLALGAPILIGGAWLARRTHGLARRYLVAGMSLLIGSALGLEILNGLLLSRTGQSRTYVLSTTLEELCEAIGAALLFCAPLAALDIRLDAAHSILVRIDPDAFPARPRHMRRPATVTGLDPAQRTATARRHPNWPRNPQAVSLRPATTVSPQMT